MRPAQFVAIIGLIVLTANGLIRAQADPDPSLREYDCGTLALYNLLRLEGRSTDLATIERHLPVTNGGRYSLKDLRDAARVSGLNLDGVQLAKSDKAPTQLALVHLDRKPDGHFLLVRPVGFTGKLVQVIDSTQEPFVLDAANLYASPEWTGLALVPSRPNWPVRAVGLVSIAAGLTLVVVGLLRKFRSRSHPGQTVSATDGVIKVCTLLHILASIYRVHDA